jgi:DNA-binding transcriptional ArsR family regulator
MCLFLQHAGTFMSEPTICMAALADALGNTIRWRALQELATGESLMTIELSERTGKPPNALSRHLKILVQVGLITQNRAGLYSIPPQRIVSKEERILDYGACLLRLGGLK